MGSSQSRSLTSCLFIVHISAGNDKWCPDYSFVLTSCCNEKRLRIVILHEEFHYKNADWMILGKIFCVVKEQGQGRRWP